MLGLMRAPWIVLVVGACTQPTAEIEGSEQLAAAADKIDAAATKLEAAAASLEQSVDAMKAMRAEEAEAERLAGEARSSRPRPAPIPEHGAEGASTRTIPGAAEAIACPSEGKCTIERTFLETLTTDPSLLARQLRIVPSQKDGEVQGFNLYAIRPGSLPALLGFANGDLVVRMGGKDLRSVEDAMAAYAGLRDVDRLDIEFIRRGTPLLLELAFVD